MNDFVKTNRNDDRDELLDDLEDDFRANQPVRRPEVARLRTRLERLERTVRALSSGSANVVTQGEATLAKAVSGFTSADALLAYAERVVDDATTIGVISSHVSAGDFGAAQDVLIEHQERQTVAKAADAMQQTVGAANNAGLADAAPQGATNEMLTRFGAVERLLVSLQARLDRLEQRPTAPAPAQPQTVAKAAGSKRRMIAEEQKTKLLHEIDTYVGDPSTVGFLTSKLEAGEYAEVRSVVAGAKRAHESARGA